MLRRISIVFLFSIINCYCYCQLDSVKHLWGMYFNIGRCFPQKDFKYNPTTSDNLLELAKSGSAIDLGAFYMLNRKIKINLEFTNSNFGFDNKYILNLLSKDTINHFYYWQENALNSYCNYNSFNTGFEYIFKIKKIQIAPQINMGFNWFNSKIQSYYKLKEKNANYTQTIFIRNDKKYNKGYFTCFPGFNFRYNLFDCEYYVVAFGIQTTYYFLKPEIGINFTYTDMYNSEEKIYQPPIHHSKSIAFISILGGMYMTINPSIYKVK